MHSKHTRMRMNADILLQRVARRYSRCQPRLPKSSDGILIKKSTKAARNHFTFPNSPRTKRHPRPSCPFSLHE